MDFQQLTINQSTQLSQLVSTSTYGIGKPIHQKDGQHFLEILELLSIQQIETLQKEKANKLTLDSLTSNTYILPSQVLNNEVLANLTQEQIAELITNFQEVTSETSLVDNKNTELLPGLLKKQLDKVGNIKTEELANTKVVEVNVDKVDKVDKMKTNDYSQNKSIAPKVIQLTNNSLDERLSQTKTTGDNLIIQDNSRILQNKPNLFANVSVFTAGTKVQNNAEKPLLNDGQARSPNTLVIKESEVVPETVSNLKVTTESELTSKSNSNLEQNSNFNNDLVNKAHNQTNNSQLNGTNNFQGLLEQVHNDKGSNTENSVAMEEIPDYLIKQIKSKAHVIKPDGSSELNIKLKPEELGKLTLKISLQDGQVTVKILTENNHARGLVEQNLTQLKQTLNNQGIKCNSIDVQIGSDSNLQHFFGQQSNPFNNSRNTTKFKLSSKLKGESKQFIDSIEIKSENKSNRNMGLGNVEFFA